MALPEGSVGVKLIPTIEAGDPFSWSLDVSYETDEFSVQLTPEFTELFSFSSFKGRPPSLPSRDGP